MERWVARPTDTSIFLERVRKAGGRIGNRALQEILAWPDDKYWKIHRDLHEGGKIEKGRGKGGTVILVEATVPTALEAPTIFPVVVQPEIKGTSAPTIIEAIRPDEPILRREIDLYTPALEQLTQHWAQHRQLEQCYCEITAQQGRRDTGGSWSRPDITVVGYKKYEYIPDKYLEVFSFEIKDSNDISIKGVLEALAHREAATRSYVIYHTDGKPLSDYQEAIRIEEIAARHGIGVYIAQNIADFNSWEEMVTAPRVSPDPDTLELFIKRTLSETAKTRLRKWF